MCGINSDKLYQELCECLREELSELEKKAVPSKESIKDLERIVKTLEQEKVCVRSHVLVSSSFSSCYFCFDIKVLPLEEFVSLTYQTNKSHVLIEDNIFSRFLLNFMHQKMYRLTNFQLNHVCMRESKLYM